MLLPMQKPGPKVADNEFESLAKELFAAESGGGYKKKSKAKSASKKSVKKKPAKKPAKKPNKKKKKR